MAVARAEHDRRVAAGFLASTPNPVRRVSRLNISAVKATAPDHKKSPGSPVDDPSRDHKKVRCKSRPEPKKDRKHLGGAGTSKRFVPWC